MFRWYGVLGLIMVAFAQINFFFQVQPFAQWYFPIIWFGFIFVIDAVNYSLNGQSLMVNKPRIFLMLLIVSAIVWWMFEFIGYILQNWYYVGTEGFTSTFEKLLFGTISFATVIPAVFETSILLKSIHLFDGIVLKKRHDISKELLFAMMFFGVLTFFLTVLWPRMFFPFIWLSFFLILDPINYINKRPSIVGHLKDRKLAVPLSLFVGATLTGVLWEFWNYWAIPKWIYTLPIADFFHVFEMPLLGYLGYGPFGWELYAMYHFLMWMISYTKTRSVLFKK